MGPEPHQPDDRCTGCAMRYRQLQRAVPRNPLPAPLALAQSLYGSPRTGRDQPDVSGTPDSHRGPHRCYMRNCRTSDAASDPSSGQGCGRGRRCFRERLEEQTMLLRWRNWVIFLTQSLTICATLILAWLLRFDFTLPHRRLLLWALVLLIVVRLTAIYGYRLNHGYWRYTGIGDLKDLVKAVSLGSVVFFAALRGAGGVVVFPLSVYILEGILAFLFLAALRVGVRVYFQWRRSQYPGT